MKKHAIAVCSIALVVGALAVPASVFAEPTAPPATEPTPAVTAVPAPATRAAASAAATAHISYVPETDSLVLKETSGIAELGALEPGQTCVVPESGRDLGSSTPQVSLESTSNVLTQKLAEGKPLSVPQIEVGLLGSCTVADNKGFLVRTYTFSVTADATAPMGATYEIRPAALSFFFTVG